MDVLVSVAPIVLLIVLMTKKNSLPSHVALPVVAMLIYAIKLVYFESDPNLINATVVDGLLSAWAPILITWGAIFMFKTMEASGSKDLMTPLDQYTTISQDASLKDAFLVMEGAFRGQQMSDPTHPRDFAVLVVDQDRQVIGRLVVWDVLRGLETQQVKRVDSLSMVEGYGVWSQPLSNLATKAQYIQVKNLVRRLHKDELVSADASLDKAIHALVGHRFLSLIVTERGQTVGVLRVVDVFSHVCAMVREA